MELTPHPLAQLAALHPGPWLTISNHFAVTRCLTDLGNAELMSLGGALGLHYPHLQRMAPLMEELISSWLRSEDSVIAVGGPPSWASLAQALRSIGQNGIANNIETG